MMYLKALLTAAATIPASAIYNIEGEEGVAQSVDGSPQVALTAFLPDDEQAADGDGGDFAITALPVDGKAPLSGDVAITSTETGSAILSSDSQDEEQAPVLYDSPLIGPTWSLIEYHNATSDSMVDVVGGSYITIEFEEDGRFDGHSGCNGYSGGYSDPAVNSTFAVEGPLATTLMLCPDEEVNRQEMAYHTIFEGDIKWSISKDGTSLELTDGDGGYVLAQYELYSPPIIGTIWQATQFFDESSGGLVNVTKGSSITFNMEVNEKIDGNAGCNTYIGSYDDLTSTSFVVDGPMVTTRMICDPQVVNDQEVAYLANFKEGSQADWAVLDDGSLELRQSGDIFATYEAVLEAQEPLSELELGAIDTTWHATQFLNVSSGELVDVAEGSSITFKMEANEEKFDGNAGCNNYFGAYDDLTSTSFAIDGPVVSTEMFCEYVNDQEMAYLANFEDGRHVDWAVLDDGSLELRDADSGDVFVKYSTGLKAREEQEPLSESGAMAFGTSVATLVMVAAMVFI